MVSLLIKKCKSAVIGIQALVFQRSVSFVIARATPQRECINYFFYTSSVMIAQYIYAGRP